MNIKEYENLKSVDIYGVLEKVRKSLDWVDRSDQEKIVDLGDDEYLLPACFILWKLKHSDKKYTAEEYYRNGCGEEQQFQIFDDVIGFLEESKQWDVFAESKDNYSDDELKAVVLHLYPYWDGEDSIPEEVLSLADSCLAITDGDEVVEYYANHFEFSLFSNLNHRAAKYVAYEDLYSRRGLASAKAQMMGLDKISLWGEIEAINECDKVFVNGSFTSAINTGNSNLYYDNERFEDYLKKEWKDYPEGKYPVWNVCSSALKSVNKGGRVVALMAAGQLSGKETEEVRKFLVESKCIKGAIALPEKLFREIWVSVYVLILEKGSETIRFCDAREKYVRGRIKGKQINRLTTDGIKEIYDDFICGEEYSRTVSLEEVQQNDYTLLPQRYVGINQYKESFIFDECIWEINRGMTLSATQMDELVTAEQTDTRCITPSCLSNGVITRSYFFREDKYNKKKNYVSPGDILINKTGKPIRAAIADRSYIVIGNTYIVKLKDSKIDPYYIKCFLESKKGQQELEKYAVGAKTPLISVANLRKLEIPVFGPKKQKRVEQQARETTLELQRIINETADMSSLFD